ncbi:hypothetical protein E2C01_024649 [Portunus trituberculatus]|uniref:Uncharacterized protein n=1 Tax=Portunus trituberculatus TaxID=210409 RepID=A0A5B7EB59_PORTR|nr:hypothetical protein [Portunus trituberculatus]
MTAPPCPTPPLSFDSLQVWICWERIWASSIPRLSGIIEAVGAPRGAWEGRAATKSTAETWHSLMMHPIIHCILKR